MNGDVGPETRLIYGSATAPVAVVVEQDSLGALLEQARLRIAEEFPAGFEPGAYREEVTITVTVEAVAP